MSTDEDEPTSGDSDVTACLTWLFLFGSVGVLVLIIASMAVEQWCDKESLRRDRALLAEQIKDIKQGNTDCLVQPAPQAIDELLADAACASKIREFYLGGDVSDPRLGRLRDLPNLKSVVLLAADAPDKFLEKLQGATGIEELSMVWCSPSPQGIGYISTLPNLKKFGLCVGHFDAGDWQSICKALPQCKCSLSVLNR